MIDAIGTTIFFTLVIIFFIAPFIYWMILNSSEKIANGVKYKWRTIFILLAICWPISFILLIISFLLFGGSVDPESLETVVDSISYLRYTFLEPILI